MYAHNWAEETYDETVESFLYFGSMKLSYQDSQTRT